MGDNHVKNRLSTYYAISKTSRRGEVIYKPDPDDDNGYFLEHGLVFLIDNGSLDFEGIKKNAACVLTGPVILNAPNLILKSHWDVGQWQLKNVKYIFLTQIYLLVVLRQRIDF